MMLSALSPRVLLVKLPDSLFCSKHSVTSACGGVKLPETECNASSSVGCPTVLSSSLDYQKSSSGNIISTAWSNTCSPANASNDQDLEIKRVSKRKKAKKEQCLNISKDSDLGLSALLNDTSNSNNEHKKPCHSKSDITNCATDCSRTVRGDVSSVTCNAKCDGVYDNKDNCNLLFPPGQASSLGMHKTDAPTYGPNIAESVMRVRRSNYQEVRNMVQMYIAEETFGLYGRYSRAPAKHAIVKDSVDEVRSKKTGRMHRKDKNCVPVGSTQREKANASAMVHKMRNSKIKRRGRKPKIFQVVEQCHEKLETVECVPTHNRAKNKRKRKKLINNDSWENFIKDGENAEERELSGSPPIQENSERNQHLNASMSEKVMEAAENDGEANIDNCMVGDRLLQSNSETKDQRKEQSESSESFEGAEQCCLRSDETKSPVAKVVARRRRKSNSRNKHIISDENECMEEDRVERNPADVMDKQNRRAEMCETVEKDTENISIVQETVLTEKHEKTKNRRQKQPTFSAGDAQNLESPEIADFVPVYSRLNGKKRRGKSKRNQAATEETLHETAELKNRDHENIENVDATGKAQKKNRKKGGPRKKSLNVTWLEQADLENISNEVKESELTGQQRSSSGSRKQCRATDFEFDSETFESDFNSAVADDWELKCEENSLKIVRKSKSKDTTTRTSRSNASNSINDSNINYVESQGCDNLPESCEQTTEEELPFITKIQDDKHSVKIVFRRHSQSKSIADEQNQDMCNVPVVLDASNSQIQNEKVLTKGKKKRKSKRNFDKQNTIELPSCDDQPFEAEHELFSGTSTDNGSIPSPSQNFESSAIANNVTEKVKQYTCNLMENLDGNVALKLSGSSSADGNDANEQSLHCGAVQNFELDNMEIGQNRSSTQDDVNCKADETFGLFSDMDSCTSMNADEIEENTADDSTKHLESVEADVLSHDGLNEEWNIELFSDSYSVTRASTPVGSPCSNGSTESVKQMPKLSGPSKKKSKKDINSGSNKSSIADTEEQDSQRNKATNVSMQTAERGPSEISIDEWNSIITPTFQWFTVSTPTVGYCDGIRVDRRPHTFLSRASVRVPLSYSENDELLGIGKERLLLWKMTKDDVCGLQEQVRIETKHRQTEHIMPVVLSMTEHEIEQAYEGVINSVKSDFQADETAEYFEIRSEKSACGSTSDVGDFGMEQMVDRDDSASVATLKPHYTCTVAAEACMTDTAFSDAVTGCTVIHQQEEKLAMFVTADDSRIETDNNLVVNTIATSSDVNSAEVCSDDTSSDAAGELRKRKSKGTGNTESPKHYRAVEDTYRRRHGGDGGQPKKPKTGAKSVDNGDTKRSLKSVMEKSEKSIKLCRRNSRSSVVTKAAIREQAAADIGMLFLPDMPVGINRTKKTELTGAEVTQQPGVESSNIKGSLMCQEPSDVAELTEDSLPSLTDVDAKDCCLAVEFNGTASTAGFTVDVVTTSLALLQNTSERSICGNEMKLSYATDIPSESLPDITHFATLETSNSVIEVDSQKDLLAGGKTDTPRARGDAGDEDTVVKMPKCSDGSGNRHSRDETTGHSDKATQNKANGNLIQKRKNEQSECGRNKRMKGDHQVNDCKRVDNSAKHQSAELSSFEPVIHENDSDDINVKRTPPDVGKQIKNKDMTLSHSENETKSAVRTPRVDEKQSSKTHKHKDKQDTLNRGTDATLKKSADATSATKSSDKVSSSSHDRSKSAARSDDISACQTKADRHSKNVEKSQCLTENADDAVGIESKTTCNRDTEFSGKVRESASRCIVYHRRSTNGTSDGAAKCVTATSGLPTSKRCRWLCHDSQDLTRHRSKDSCNANSSQLTVKSLQASDIRSEKQAENDSSKPAPSPSLSFDRTNEPAQQNTERELPYASKVLLFDKSAVEMSKIRNSSDTSRKSDKAEVFPAWKKIGGTERETHQVTKSSVADALRHTDLHEPDVALREKPCKPQEEIKLIPHENISVTDVSRTDFTGQSLENAAAELDGNECNTTHIDDSGSVVISRTVGDSSEAETPETDKCSTEHETLLQNECSLVAESALVSHDDKSSSCEKSILESAADNSAFSSCSDLTCAAPVIRSSATEMISKECINDSSYAEQPVGNPDSIVEPCARTVTLDNDNTKCQSIRRLEQRAELGHDQVNLNDEALSPGLVSTDEMSSASSAVLLSENKDLVVTETAREVNSERVSEQISQNISTSVAVVQDDSASPIEGHSRSDAVQRDAVEVPNATQSGVNTCVIIQQILPANQTDRVILPETSENEIQSPSASPSVSSCPPPCEAVAITTEFIRSSDNCADITLPPVDSYSDVVLSVCQDHTDSSECEMKLVPSSPPLAERLKHEDFLNSSTFDNEIQSTVKVNENEKFSASENTIPPASLPFSKSPQQEPMIASADSISLDTCIESRLTCCVIPLEATESEIQPLPAIPSCSTCPQHERVTVATDLIKSSDCCIGMRLPSAGKDTDSHIVSLCQNETDFPKHGMSSLPASPPLDECQARKPVIITTGFKSSGTCDDEIPSNVKTYNSQKFDMQESVMQASPASPTYGTVPQHEPVIISTDFILSHTCGETRSTGGGEIKEPSAGESEIQSPPASPSFNSCPQQEPIVITTDFIDSSNSIRREVPLADTADEIKEPDDKEVQSPPASPLMNSRPRRGPVIITTDFVSFSPRIGDHLMPTKTITAVSSEPGSINRLVREADSLENEIESPPASPFSNPSPQHCPVIISTDFIKSESPYEVAGERSNNLNIIPWSPVENAAHDVAGDKRKKAVSAEMEDTGIRSPSPCSERHPLFNDIPTIPDDFHLSDPTEVISFVASPVVKSPSYGGADTANSCHVAHISSSPRGDRDSLSSPLNICQFSALRSTISPALRIIPSSPPPPPSSPACRGIQSPDQSDDESEIVEFAPRNREPVVIPLTVEEAGRLNVQSSFGDKIGHKPLIIPLQTISDRQLTVIPLAFDGEDSFDYKQKQNSSNRGSDSRSTSMSKIAPLEVTNFRSNPAGELELGEAKRKLQRTRENRHSTRTTDAFDIRQPKAIPLITKSVDYIQPVSIPLEPDANSDLCRSVKVSTSVKRPAAAVRRIPLISQDFTKLKYQPHSSEPAVDEMPVSIPLEPESDMLCQLAAPTSSLIKRRSRFEMPLMIPVDDGESASAETLDGRHRQPRTIPLNVDVGDSCARPKTIPLEVDQP